MPSHHDIVNESALFHEDMSNSANYHGNYAFDSVLGFDAPHDPHAHLTTLDNDRRVSICSLGQSFREEQALFDESDRLEDVDEERPDPVSEEEEEEEQTPSPVTKRDSDRKPRRGLKGGKVWRSLRNLGSSTNNESSSRPKPKNSTSFKWKKNVAATA